MSSGLEKMSSDGAVNDIYRHTKVLNDILKTVDSRQTNKRTD